MKKLFVLMAVLALLGAACQSNTTVDTSAAAGDESDSSGEPAPNTDEDPTPAPADTEGTAEPVATTAPVEAPTAEAGASSGSTGDDPTPEPEPTSEPTAEREPYEPTAEQLAIIQTILDTDDWCIAAAAVEEGTATFDTINFTDPVELEASFSMSIAVITAAQQLAPSQIEADVDATVDAFTKLAVALEDANWSFLDLDLSVIDQFDDALVQETYNIELYNFTVCGLGENPGEPPTFTEPSADPTAEDQPPFEGTVRDQALAGFIDAGFTAEEANCLLDKLDLSDPNAFTDTTALFSIFTDCNISLDRLADLGGG